MAERSISRRTILGLIGAGAVGAAAGVTSWAITTRDAQTPAPGPGSAPGSAALTEPAVLASRNTVLDVALTAASGVRLAGRDTAALGFNATSPGPTLRVAPGDLLRVRLTNHLDQPTNLHTHGVHVSPLANSDNPFLSVEPGAAFDYAYRIPPDHPTGTFWYHPHRHGYTAGQVFGGLVGALLIDSPSGGAPELDVAHDRVLVITDTTLDAAGQVAAPGPMDIMMGRQGQLVLVNGQHQPVIPGAPQAAQRWRIVNATASRTLSLRLEGHQLTHIAQDGVFLPAPAVRDRIVLAAAGRADAVIRPTHAGRFALITEIESDSMMGGMGGMGGPSAGPVALATLAVTGLAAPSPALPAALPAPLPPPGPVTGTRQLTMAMGMTAAGTGTPTSMGMGMGAMSFTIDGRSFDPARDDHTVALGTTEDWTVLNTSPMDHPFHLHVWPFQVLADSTGTPPAGVRQDVVLVPARGWVRLRIPFTDYPGRSVYHCHILDHEDAGMMGTLNVTLAPGAGQVT